MDNGRVGDADRATQASPEDGLPASPSGEYPSRVQLRRAKGWRMPPNTVKVDRTTKWGNPFIPGKPCAYTGGRPVQDKRHAFSLYRAIAPDNEALVAAARAELRGKNLACWCPVELYPEDGHCHADVLLKIANASGSEARQGGDGLSGSVHDGPAPEAEADAQNTTRSDQ